MKAHLVELQSFRGFAALLVLVHHCTLYYIYPYRTWSGHLLNAHAAVVSFFVLSGYVLSLSLAGEPPSREAALRFYVRRLFRIYPALFGACAFALAGVLILQGPPLPPTVSHWWVHELRDGNISPLKTVAAFCGLGTYLPIPMWSLFVELVGSLAMPGIVLVVSRGRRAAALLIGILLVFSITFGDRTRLWAGEYLVEFALGASITTFAPVFSWLGRTPLRARLSALASCAVLLFGRLLGPWDFEKHYHAPIPAAFEAFAAMALIGVIVLGASPFGILRHRASMFLGDISYSLYLIHLSVLMLVAALGEEVFELRLFKANTTLATLSLVSFTVPITILLAAMSYRYIELPGIELGKRALRSWASRKHAAALATR